MQPANHQTHHQIPQQWTPYQPQQGMPPPPMGMQPYPQQQQMMMMYPPPFVSWRLLGAMRVGVATPKRSPGYQHRPSQFASPGNCYHGTPPNGYQSENDTNRTIFVGGVDADTTEEDIRQPFSQFGEIVSLKIPVGKGYAFVQFTERNNAEDAIQSLYGTVIGKQIVRLAWGRTPANKQSRNNHHQHWNGGMNWEQSYRGQGHFTPQRQDHNTHKQPKMMNHETIQGGQTTES